MQDDDNAEFGPMSCRLMYYTVALAFIGAVLLVIFLP